MRNFQYLLFDLDGTITDSEEGILNSVRYSLSKYGIQNPDSILLRKFIGPPLVRSLVEHFRFSDEDAKTAVSYYREYFSKRGIYENKLYPGIDRLLQSLSDEGKSIILATAKPTYYARKILKHFKIGHLFTEVVGSNMDGTRIDKTEVLQHILNQYRDKNPELFIMIGDRQSDMMAAEQFGIKKLWVNYGYGDDEEMNNSRPDFVANSIEDLYPLLLGITRAKYK